MIISSRSEGFVEEGGERWFHERERFASYWKGIARGEGKFRKSEFGLILRFLLAFFNRLVSLAILRSLPWLFDISG